MEVNIELEITLKCNASCVNCNKFCNMEDLGIVYDDEMDLSLEDVDKFIHQVKNMGNVKNIRVMGGEPTVHPLYEEICQRLKTELMDSKIINEAYVVTNGIIKRDSCLRPLIQMPMMHRKNFHTCALVAPSDLGHVIVNEKCTTPKIYGVSYNKLGWYPCGPGGAIARLFKMEHMSRDSISSTDDWGSSIMDICSLCQNKFTPRLLEKDHGRLITESYRKAIDNYVGKTIYTVS